MSKDRLIEEIERLGPWQHDIEVKPGITTRGFTPTAESGIRFPDQYSPDRMMRRLIGNVYPEGLQGRSFLDCACNSGGHSIAAVKLGAGRGFGFDARQHWIDQCEFLAREIPVPELSFRRCELADVPALGLEPFDVTMFSGLFYHLADPVAGLRIAADLTKELIIVNTSGIRRRGKALILSPESVTHPLSGVDGIAWLPSGPAVMRDILAWCGFEHSRVDLYWSPGDGPRGWTRMQILGARDAATFAEYDRRRPDAVAPPTLTRRVLRRLYRMRQRLR